MFKLFRKPLFHCLVLGAIIVFYQWRTAPPPDVFVSQQEINDFKEQLIKSFGRGQAIDTDRIIEQLAEDKILYIEAKEAGFDKLDTVVTRLANVADFLQLVPKDSTLDERYQAALAMKLDETDIVVRRQMITLYKTALKNSWPAEQPTAQQIQDWYDNNPELYMQAARFAFSHVYLQQSDSNDLQKAELLQQRLADEYTLTEENGESTLANAIALGDVFYGGHNFRLQSQRQIARHFGQNFAEQLPELVVGQWNQPLVSAFGFHIIWLADKTDASLKPIEDVKANIERELLMQAEEAAFKSTLQKITAQYAIQVEDDNQQYQRWPASPALAEEKP